MTDTLKTISPIDGSIYQTRALADGPEIDSALANAQQAFQKWRRVSIADRAAVLRRAVDAFVADGAAIAEEITRQTGRPISQSPGEIRGFEERARYMIGIAPDALADIAVGEKPNFTRFIRREPLGTVFVIAPWNFPYLTSINAIIPALMAGNTVILKHSQQTPLCAERLSQAFQAAGLPKGTFQYLHLSHENTNRVIGNEAINFVAFTGSVSGGRAVQTAAVDRFIDMGLELGGCDPAYVRSDVDLPHAIESLVDGAFFNSGQSCCGIQRIYVHEDVYHAFRDGYVELTKGYKLGNPLDPEVNLGPVVRLSAAKEIHEQIARAIHAGATALIDARSFEAARPNTTYVAPQVLEVTDNHNPIMQDECFGPVVGIMKVGSDAEAIRLMNENIYGLTASVWTKSEAEALAIGDQVDTGTWFMNRCDYLDPALAWTGVKDSGRGCTLSRVGYEHLTRPKSFHLRLSAQS